MVAFISRYKWLVIFVFFNIAILITQKLIIPNVVYLNAGEGIIKGDSKIYYDWAVGLSSRLKNEGFSSFVVFVHDAAGINVSLPSIIFYLFGNNINFIAPLNALLASLSVFFLSRILLLFSTKKNLVFFISFFAFITPSTWLWITQLHKENYTHLAWFLFFYSILAMKENKHFYKIFISCLISSMIFLVTRPMYLNLILLLGSFSVLIYLLLSRKNQLQTYLKATYFILPIIVTFILFYALGFQNVSTEDQMIVNTTTKISNLSKKCDHYSWEPTFSNSFWERKISAVATVRNRQTCNLVSIEGLYAELNFLPRNILDLVQFLPKALYISIFEPTPKRLLEKSGWLALIVMSEMIIFYIAFSCIVLFLITEKDKSNAWVVLIIMSLGMIFFAYMTPNLGTLHRIRSPFMILAISLGFTLLTEKLFSGKKYLK